MCAGRAFGALRHYRYRDYNDIDFVTRISQPSFDIEKARLFMSGIDALGGGDHPEAVTQALRDSETIIGWRSGATRRHYYRRCAAACARNERGGRNCRAL